jgi:hypothetical protein
VLTDPELNPLESSGRNNPNTSAKDNILKLSRRILGKDPPSSVILRIFRTHIIYPAGCPSHWMSITFTVISSAYGIDIVPCVEAPPSQKKRYGRKKRKGMQINPTGCPFPPSPTPPTRPSSWPELGPHPFHQPSLSQPPIAPRTLQTAAPTWDWLTNPDPSGVLPFPASPGGP